MRGTVYLDGERALRGLVDQKKIYKCTERRRQEDLLKRLDLLEVEDCVEGQTRAALKRRLDRQRRQRPEESPDFENSRRNAKRGCNRHARSFHSIQRRWYPWSFRRLGRHRDRRDIGARTRRGGKSRRRQRMRRKKSRRPPGMVRRHERLPGQRRGGGQQHWKQRVSLSVSSTSEGGEKHWYRALDVWNKGRQNRRDRRASLVLPFVSLGLAFNLLRRHPGGSARPEARLSDTDRNH
uniref:Uncharacterized protein n=1 Tax=Toxoplasma gondii COUG TaxID=1074873 RepID=A0A2G8XY31_TOXGO|nr:hypothetical protein TGCOUG_220128 [Toxoplasma gondii COUG]